MIHVIRPFDRIRELVRRQGLTDEAKLYGGPVITKLVYHPPHVHVSVEPVIVL
jgi:hypothetical protein